MTAVLLRCSEAVDSGEAPFAAMVVREGEILSIENDLVRSTLDPTAHSQLLAIRSACEKISSPDLHGCTLYCTTEPCPMCFGAAFFARISRVVYGATIGDAALAGYDQMPIFASQLKTMARVDVEIVPELMREQCVALIREARGAIKP
jgi:tRNA(Arg) A34 adenosine deaminase TadA